MEHNNSLVENANMSRKNVEIILRKKGLELYITKNGKEGNEIFKISYKSKKRVIKNASDDFITIGSRCFFHDWV